MFCSSKLLCMFAMSKRNNNSNFNLMKKATFNLSKQDVMTLSACTLISSILFTGILLIAGFILLGIAAYKNYKSFLEATEQITVSEELIFQDVVILNQTFKTASQSIFAKHINKMQMSEVDFLPLQLGMSY